MSDPKCKCGGKRFVNVGYITFDWLYYYSTCQKCGRVIKGSPFGRRPQFEFGDSLKSWHEAHAVDKGQ